MKLEHEKKIIDLTKEFDKSIKKLMEENNINQQILTRYFEPHCHLKKRNIKMRMK